MRYRGPAPIVIIISIITCNFLYTVHVHVHMLGKKLHLKNNNTFFVNVVKLGNRYNYAIVTTQVILILGKRIYKVYNNKNNNSSSKRRLK